MLQHEDIDPNLPNTRDLKYWRPILDALRELGGSGTPREVREIVVKALEISDEELEQTHEKSGLNIVENDIHWSRNDLKGAGLIDASERGVWRLTKEGENAFPSYRDCQKMLFEVRRKRRLQTLEKAKAEQEEQTEAETESRELSLLEVLRGLSPDGFERFCQRLLREAGFLEVTVTGKSGDGGIDGRGILKINSLVTEHVLFQCKRWQGTVGSTVIRDFRGAMSGRTTKGIIITTGHFSVHAEEEASRDGVPPIELVDGQRLVELLEQLTLGVKPRMVFDIDFDFFDPYR